MVVRFINAFKLTAEAIEVASNELLSERLITIGEAEIIVRETLEKGGQNLLRNPTFGTEGFAEKTGWSTGHAMSLLLARFKNHTMTEMLAVLSGKTMDELIDYDY